MLTELQSQIGQNVSYVSTGFIYHIALQCVLLEGTLILFVHAATHLNRTVKYINTEDRHSRCIM